MQSSPQPPPPPPPPPIDAASQPSICALLLAEAQYWHALHQLHGWALPEARALADVNEAEVVRSADEAAREAAYVSALCALASSFECAACECLRLRATRLARREVEQRVDAHVVRAHAAEVRAVGTALAGRAQGSCASVTSALRVANQRVKNQISQLNELIGIVAEFEALPIPHDAELLLTIDHDGAERGRACSLRALLQLVYEQSATPNVHSVATALQRAFGPASGAPEAAAPAATVPAAARFPRRPTAE